MSEYIIGKVFQDETDDQSFLGVESYLDAERMLNGDKVQLVKLTNDIWMSMTFKDLDFCKNVSEFNHLDVFEVNDEDEMEEILFSPEEYRV